MYKPKIIINGVEVNRPNSENEFGLKTSNIVNQQAADDIFSKTEANITKNSISINPHIDWDKYKKYGVTVNPLTTEEDIKKQATVYQSNWEKLGRAIGQGLWNEAVVGTGKAFSELIDLAIIAVNKDAYVGEYANPITKYLEDYQEELRNNWEVYKKDPNARFAFNDFGWWAEGFVNVATTLSLLIPAKAISKGLSLIPKAIVGGMSKAGKMNKAYSLMGNLMMKTNKARGAKALSKADISKRISKTDLFNDVASSSFFSRSIENFQESRETYKIVEDNAKNSLAKMTDSEREEFYARNEDRGYRNMSDEDIAKDIARNSANETFKQDYWMLLMDMAQFAGINKLFTKTMFSKVAGKNIDYENKLLIQGLSKNSREYLDDVASRSIDKIGSDHAKRTILDRLKSIKTEGVDRAFLGNTLLFGFESTGEGFEELFQGIQVERAKNIADMVLNPEVNERSINSYLNDEALWEQAFWGMIGGAVFQATGAGLNALSKRQYIKNNKDILTEEQITSIKYGINKQQLEDIKRRREFTDKLYHDLQYLENNKDPHRYKTDYEGNIERDENNNPINLDLTDEEVAIRKNQLLDEYILNLYLNAYQSNTTDLLTEFINSKELAKSMHENTIGMGRDAEEFNRMLNERYNYIANEFNNTLYDVGTGIDKINPFAAQIYAKHVVNNKLKVEQNNRLIDYFDSLIEQESDIEGNYSATINNRLARDINYKLNKIDEEDNKLYQLRNNKEISQVAYDIRRKELQKLTKRFSEKISDIEGISEVVKQHIKGVIDSKYFDLSSIYEIQNVLNNVTYGGIQATPNYQISKYIDYRNALLVDSLYRDSQIPKDNKELYDGYEAMSYGLDNYVTEKENKAFEIIKDYITKSDNPKQTFADVMDNNNLPEDIEEASHILKLGIGVNVVNGEIVDTRKRADGKPIFNTNIFTLKRAAELAEAEKLRNDENTSATETVGEEYRTENVAEETYQEETSINEEENTEEEMNKEESAEENEYTEETLISTGEEMEAVQIEEEIPVIIEDDDVEIPDFIDEQADVIDDSVDMPTDREIYIFEQQAAVDKKIESILFSKSDIVNSVINNGGYNSKDFVNLYNDILFEVKGYDVTTEYIHGAIAKKLSDIGNMLTRQKDNRTQELGKAIKALSIDLYKKDVIEYLSKVVEKFSNIPGINDLSISEIFEKYIDDYINKYGIVTRKNNRDQIVIDIEHLLYDIIENTNLNYDEKVFLIEQFSTFVEDIESYVFINKDIFNDLKIAPKSLIEALINKKQKALDDLVGNENVLSIDGGSLSIDVIVDNVLSIGAINKNIPSEILKIVNKDKKSITYDEKNILIDYTVKFLHDNIDNPKYYINFELSNSKYDNNLIFNLYDSGTNERILNHIGFLAEVVADSSNNRYSIKRFIYDYNGNDVLNNNSFVWDIEKINDEYVSSQLDYYFEQLINAATNDNLKNNNTSAAKLLNILLSRNNGKNTKNILFDIKNQNDINQAIDLLNNDLVKKLYIGYGHDGAIGAFADVHGMYRHVKVIHNGKLDIVYYDNNGNEISIYNDIPTYNKAIISIANNILSRTNEILLYDYNTAQSNKSIAKDLLMASYKAFKQKTYNEYQIRHKLINDLTSGKKINIKVVGNNSISVNMDKKTKTKIAKLTKELNSVDNPIVISDTWSTVKVEGRKNSISLPQINKSSSSMGILLTDPSKETAIVSWLDNDNMNGFELTGKDNTIYDTKRKELGDAVKKEIMSVLTEYGNSEKSKDDFKNIYNKLSQLLGGANTNRGHLFSGVDLFYSPDKGSGSAIAIVLNNKYDKNKSLKEQADIILLSGNEKQKPRIVYKDGKVNVFKYLFNQDNTINNENIKNLVEKMHKAIRFNKSYYMFKATNYNDSNKDNEYYRKVNGKLELTIGDYKRTFDSFSQFLYLHNAFTLNLKQNADGSIKRINHNNNSYADFKIIYDAVDSETSPVEKEQYTYNEQGLVDIIENLKDGDKVNTKELLSNISIDERYVNLLFGDNEHNIKLLDDVVYYDDKLAIPASFKRVDKRTKGKIYIGKKTLQYLKDIENREEYKEMSSSIKNSYIDNFRSRELQRLLIHENLHKQLIDNENIKSEEIVNELINTLIAAVESTKTSKHKNLKLINDWLTKDFGVTFDEDGTFNLEKTIEVYNKNYGKKVDRNVFAEEWLVEVLTNKPLMEYLADTKYILNGKEIEVGVVEEKSLFQKIIDILLKFFGINLENREKNSIFAEQYRLLSGINTIKQNTVKTEIVENVNEDSTNAETNVEEQEEIITNNEEVNNIEEVEETIDTDENIVEEDVGVGFSEEVIVFDDEENVFEDIEDYLSIDEEYYSTIPGIYTEEEIKLADYKNNGNTNTYGIISAKSTDEFIKMFPIQEQPLIAKNLENFGIKYLC